MNHGQALTLPRCKSCALFTPSLSRVREREGVGG